MNISTRKILEKKPPPLEKLNLKKTFFSIFFLGMDLYAVRNSGTLKLKGEKKKHKKSKKRKREEKHDEGLYFVYIILFLNLFK